VKITVPELSLVVLIGPSGCGKSTFARQQFRPTEVLSSDYCRGLVSDDENNQTSTKEAFEVLHFIARKRLAAGRLTVIDATNVQPESRKPLVALAREFHVMPIAIVFDFPEKLCHERNRSRPDRNFGPHVVRNQAQQLRRSMRGLEREGFRGVHVFKAPENLEGVEIERQPMWTNRRTEQGPFDIIGDVHGCFDELQELMTALGYSTEKNGDGYEVGVPESRKAIFLGDLVDRGPKIVEVLRLVMGMVESGTALCIPGNHDVKLLQKLRGKDVKIAHGLADSIAQLDSESPEFKAKVVEFLDGLISHYVLDEGKLVVAHAGMKEEMQGRGSAAIRSFALFGETTGETDEFGLPVRYNWAADYRGKAMVVYGHTPVAEPQWLNRTINIDTGCVFGGKLTALRYPGKELVSVPAHRMYYEPAKPLASAQPTTALSQQHEQDDVLDIDDVIGKRIIETRLPRSK
jgi:protein phosphatase